MSNDGARLTAIRQRIAMEGWNSADCDLEFLLKIIDGEVLVGPFTPVQPPSLAPAGILEDSEVPF